ncbi:MAG TPA: alpha/beta hydrolase [Thermomicrobiales bacterium]|jgi:pimeloyl-ACP methyl ester carboxylesterase|nr:alpha/beta hydrolase [Thermomicrobiales bacterium]
MTVPRTGHADVNGLRLYHEIHGAAAGTPLVLLHGGITASAGLGDVIARFAQDRTVIVPHMQGHGHTPDIDRPLRLETLADDVAGLIRHLDHGQVNVAGYSFGGGIALQLAVRHPDLVRRLVIISRAMRRDGWYPSVVAQFDAMEANADAIGGQMAASPLAGLYPGVDWTALFRRTGELVARPYDWMDDLAGLEVLVMLVYADADAITPEHMLEVWRALGGGQRDAGLDASGRPRARLAIIPNRTHYDLMADEVVADVISPFLDAAIL